MGESYISWLRFAQAHVLMGRHDSACNVLTTASELYPDKWEVWRDLSILSGHCNNFNKMILSYHKLLDIKESYSNINLLISLGKHLVLRNSHSAAISNSLRQEALDLFSRLVKRDPESPEIWALFGLIEASSENLSDDIVERSVYYLEKSVRLCTKNKHWYKKLEAALKILCSTQIIAEVYFSCYLIFKERIESKHLLQIIISFLNEVIGKVKEEYIDLITSLLKAEYRPNIEKLEEILKIFKNLDAILSESHEFQH